MAYKYGPITIPFPDLGDDVQVTILDPRLLPWSVKASLAERTQADPNKRFNSDSISDVINALVINWVVYNPFTGEPLGRPKDDPTAFLNCPSEIIEGIMKRFNETQATPKNS